MPVSNIEKEQRENQEQQGEKLDIPPPETDEQANERRLQELDETIPPYENSDQKTDVELDQAIKELNAEPPQVDISKETATKAALAEMQGEKQEIQNQLGGEKRPGIEPTAGLADKEAKDTPIAVEASREQMQETITDEIREAMSEMSTELKAVRATAENGELTPEQVMKLPSFAKMREVFKGSEEASNENVDKKLQQMAEQMSNELAEKGPEVDIQPDEIEEMGLASLVEEIDAAATENPQAKEIDQATKEMDEKKAKYRTADRGNLGGRKTQRTEEEGLRPSSS